MFQDFFQYTGRMNLLLLKKWAQVVQVAVRFHPGHLEPKHLIVSL